MIRLASLVLAIGAVTIVSAPRRAQSFARASQEAARTTWDSVYSDSQAKRGDTLYQSACAKCHGAALAGTDSAAELTGKTFLGNWDALTLDQLYDKILTSMPPDNPNTIPREQLADIVADILAQNHFPAGSQPLSGNADSLKTITLVKSNPHP